MQERFQCRAIKLEVVRVAKVVVGPVFEVELVLLEHLFHLKKKRGKGEEKRRGGRREQGRK